MDCQSHCAERDDRAATCNLQRPSAFTRGRELEGDCCTHCSVSVGLLPSSSLVAQRERIMESKRTPKSPSAPSAGRNEFDNRDGQSPLRKSPRLHA